MSLDWVVLRIPPPLLGDLRDVAEEENQSAGQFLRDLIADEVGRRREARHPAAIADWKREQIAADTEAVLAAAPSWERLQSDLKARGYALHPDGIGLALYSWPAGAYLLKSAELGYPYAALIRRLGKGSPGYSSPVADWPIDKTSAATVSP